MSWYGSIKDRVRMLLRGRREDAELDAEIAFHLDMETDKLVRRGLTRAEARRRAMIAFGGVDRFTEKTREERGTRALTDLAQDVRFALRQARRNPAFSLIAALTMGLGIGATVLGVAIADAVVLRPLPYPEPDRLVRIQEENPEGDAYSISAANYLDLAASTRSLTTAVAFSLRRMSLLGAGEPIQVQGMAVTPGYFGLLGSPPALGRVFGEGDAPVAAESATVVLSYGLWQRLFGADPEALGRSIDVDGTPRTVIGVAQPGTWPLAGEDLWVSFGPDPAFPRGDHRLEAIGRLAAGVTLADLRNDLGTLANDLGRTYPDTNAGWGFRVRTFPEWLISPGARRAVGVLAGAGILLLLLSSASVATLLLSRATARQQEVSLRSALGAGGFRIVRQLLVESSALSAAGAVVGLALVGTLLPAIRTHAATALPRLAELRLDTTALAVAVVATVGTGVLAGLAPALHVMQRGLAGALQRTTRLVPRGGRRTRGALVACQIALAVILLVGASLLSATFVRLGQVDPGFRTAGVLAVPLAPSAARYPAGQRPVGIFYQEVLERVRALPGVVAAGAYNVSPFRGPRPANRVAASERATTPDDFVEIQWRAVTTGFFDAMGIPLVRGRALDDEDNAWDAFVPAARAGSPPALPAVITTDLAERLWPHTGAVGRHLQWNQPGGGDLVVVGVVEPIRDVQLSVEPAPMVFLPNGILGMPELTLLVKTEPGSVGLAAAVRQAVQEVDGDNPVPEITPLEASVQAQRAGARLNAALVGGLSLVALLLASLSLYGVVSFSTRQRTREIGIRVALGATGRGAVGPIVGQALRLVLVGGAVGVAGALLLSRILTGVLFGVEPTDVRTYVFVVITLALAALLASYLPARRAARVDPARALVAE